MNLFNFCCCLSVLIVTSLGFSISNSQIDLTAYPTDSSDLRHPREHEDLRQEMDEHAGKLPAFFTMDVYFPELERRDKVVICQARGDFCFTRISTKSKSFCFSVAGTIDVDWHLDDLASSLELLPHDNTGSYEFHFHLKTTRGKEVSLTTKCSKKQFLDEADRYTKLIELMKIATFTFKDGKGSFGTCDDLLQRSPEYGTLGSSKQ